MTTLHIENDVRDYDTWKAAFDKFDRARRDRGVRSYRISRANGDAGKVVVDLEFDNATRAEEFVEFLNGVWRTPQSQAVMIEHRAPVVLEVLEDVTLS
jgi:hypothetical protein